MFSRRRRAAARFSGASRRAVTSPLHIDLVFPSFHPSSTQGKSESARGFAGRLDTRVVYTLFFSRRGKGARGNTSEGAEAITMFLPSDEGSSNPPSTTFPLVTRCLHISLCARRTLLLIPWHMLGLSDGSHKGNYNIGARGNGEFEKHRKGGLLGAHARDTLTYKVGSGGCWWDRSSTDRRRKFLPAMLQPSAFARNVERSPRSSILEIRLIAMKL